MRDVRMLIAALVLPGAVLAASAIALWLFLRSEDHGVRAGTARRCRP